MLYADPEVEFDETGLSTEPLPSREKIAADPEFEEHSFYTVASPEACASILWRDAAKAPDAAAALRITGRDLLELGVVDEVLEEPSGGNNWAPLEAGENLRAAIERHLDQLLSLSEQQLREARYSKFRTMGRFLEKTSQDVDKVA